MAALDVVYRRLVRAGLGEFCLELHSTKANKRAVMQELAAALDASLQRVAAPTVSTQRLPGVRATLSEYVSAVHKPHGSLAVSPFRAYGEFDRVIGAPRVAYTGLTDTAVTPLILEQTIRELHDLGAAAAGLGVPAEHPWRDTQRTFYTSDSLDDVSAAALTLATAVAEVISKAEYVCETFALPSVKTFADVATATTVAEVMHRSPGAPLAVLASEAWNAPPPAATRLIAQGQAVAALAQRVSQKFSDEALEQEHVADIEYIERKSQGILSFLAILDGRYRAIKKRWTTYRRPGYAASLAEQANDMKLVDRLRSDRSALDEAVSDARGLFGDLWHGEHSDWTVLANYMQWVVEFRQVCVRHGLAGRALELASHKAPNVEQVMQLRAASESAQAQLRALGELVEWPTGYLGTTPLTEIAQRARSLAEARAFGPRWAAFEVARKAVSQGIAGELLPAALSGSIACADLAAAFQRAFWLKWLTAVVRARPALEMFHALNHEQRVAEFKELDERVLLENRALLVGQLRDRVQHALRSEPAASGMPVLRREMARQRGLAPLRKTIHAAESTIRAIKPCFMMSPLTVAQYLKGDTPSFDLVIFDEASQLPAEDAVGAIIRGRRLVVVGDPKQLPPTTFFSAQVAAGAVPLADDGTPMYEDSESILEEYMGAGVPMSRLKWHYRSAHESLINFSNVSFYDSDLYTFPSVEASTSGNGLQFEFVNGVYEGKGLNAVEARRVTDEVVRFAREQLERKARGEQSQTLGVGTFNMRQQLAIQDELEQRRREHPEIEPFFDRGVPEPFFVKNLENIQGDERDVIFLSVTYAKASDGRLRYNVGPLNGDNGWRRLNVLTTRARQRMKVFSSMRGDEINAAASTSAGARLLREFLLYAEHGRLESTTAGLAADAESPFEAAVLQELTRRGIAVVPQVGVAGYRIDIGVLDDAAPGRFLCGIECDGVAYHSSETARDRDRLRQQVLEARGWTIHRVWSTDWFKDREGALNRLLSLIEQTKAQALTEREAERETRARAAAEAAAAEAEERERQSHTVAAVATATDAPYLRPTAADYITAGVEGQFGGRDLLEAPLSQVARAVTQVVSVESPVHAQDVVNRVVGMWGTRAGARIQARILEACRAAVRDGAIRKQGEFYWSLSDAVSVRSRSGMRIPADRIAPQEYEAALLAVLAGGHGFSRPQLTTEVRSVLGFGRTGAALDEAINGAVDRLLAAGKVGEASTGVRLRT
jgi:very-short-patch-repair endonuclease